MHSESEVTPHIIVRLCEIGLRLFRNNSGFAYRKDGTVSGHYGVGPRGGGGSDWIGWTPVNGVAVFTAIELKGKGGRVTAKQQKFIDMVNTAGGIAGVADSPESAVALIAKRRQEM